MASYHDPMEGAHPLELDIGDVDPLPDVLKCGRCRPLAERPHFCALHFVPPAVRIHQADNGNLWAFWYRYGRMEFTVWEVADR